MHCKNIWNNLVPYFCLSHLDENLLYIINICYNKRFIRGNLNVRNNNIW